MGGEVYIVDEGAQAKGLGPGQQFAGTVANKDLAELMTNSNMGDNLSSVVQSEAVLPRTSAAEMARQLGSQSISKQDAGEAAARQEPATKSPTSAAKQKKNPTKSYTSKTILSINSGSTVAAAVRPRFTKIDPDGPEASCANIPFEASLKGEVSDSRLAEQQAHDAS